jgi:FkbH-like protein
MFETDKYDSKLHLEMPASPEFKYEPVKNIDGMSFLLWGEHCVECAAPACYATCDLYEPRSDSRCRRFTFGAYKNSAFPSARGYGVEVRFKKWGKLEAFGNAAIWPMRSILRWERSLERAAPMADRVGKLAHRLNGGATSRQLSYIVLNKLSRSFHGRRQAKTRPEAFLLEVYNPDVREVRLQIIFSLSADDLPSGGIYFRSVPPVTKTIVLPPGYSRHDFESSAFQRILDQGLPFKITMVPEAETNIRLVFLTADLVTFKTVAPQQRVRSVAPVKCVVWDLDNTIWNGTLIEGDELTLRPGIAELLKYLDDRGILMSIASKNNFEPAVAKLREFGIADYFLYPQIDWLPKSQKIKTIAQQLNIGLDTFAFIDDSQFELDEVFRALPQLTCLQVDALEHLASNPQFQGAVTQESRSRRLYYREQISRETEQASFGDDYLGFLRSCSIVLEVSPFRLADHERVAELVQRTNQLNFSGRKYLRAHLDQMLADPRLEKYVLRCSDKYGAYGTIGFCVVRQHDLQIQIIDFMLSCRVQGKFIEQGLFSHLFEHHNPYAAPSIWVNFQPTERNTPARQVLESLGFEQYGSSQNPGADGLILRDCTRLNCDFISLVCSSEKGEPAVLARAV